MIIVDTNIWIDHHHRPDPTLSRLLADQRSWIHPYVIGEILLENLEDRRQTAEVLGDMPQAEIAMHEEVLSLIADHFLYGIGI